MGKEEVYLLKDLIICKKCGNKISPHKVRDIRYYQRRGYKKNVCLSKLINAEEIEKEIKGISRILYESCLKEFIKRSQPDLKDNVDDVLKTLINALLSISEVETDFYRSRISKIEYDIEKREGTMFLSDAMQNVTYNGLQIMGITSVNFGLDRKMTNEDLTYFKYADIQKKV